MSVAAQPKTIPAAKVLIVEDEGLIAAHLSSLLRRDGFEVVGSAESCEEALAYASNANPDLILMDIRIKGEIDGIQTAEKVRERFDIPIIFLTSHTDQETVDRAKRSGCAGFLSKPIQSTTLATTVQMGIFRYGAERDLKLQQLWLTELLAAAPEAVALLDLVGKVRFLSPRAQELTGWSQPDAAAHHISEILPLRHTATGLPANEFAALHNPSKRAFDQGLSATRRSGESFAIEGEISPILEAAKAVGAVCRFRPAATNKV